jgi:acetyltransferase-like isoleucine patch superfamily enzyme
VPIKDQGLVKTPVRIGPWSWVGVRSTILRGTVLGRGCVVAAHSVVRGVHPADSVLAGTPAKVVADRAERWRAGAAAREGFTGLAAWHAELGRWGATTGAD